MYFVNSKLYTLICTLFVIYILHHCKLIILNFSAPEIIHVLWNLYEGVFTPKLREITTMFGRNKEQWQARLRDEIGADQLSKRYGGDKPDALEFYYIRLAGQLISTPEQLQSVNMTNVCSKDVKIYENLIREVHHEPGSRKGKNFEEWGCKRKQKVWYKHK